MTDLDSVALDQPVTLAVGWRRRDALEGGRLELRGKVATTFTQNANSHLESLRSRTSRPYSPEVDLDAKDEYLLADLAEIDLGDPILDLLNRVELRDPLSVRQLPRQSLLFYAYVFPGAAIFLRKFNPYQSAKSGKMFTRLTNSLSEIEEPVFAFDDRVDVAILDNGVFISNKNAFEQLFKDNEYLVRNIPNWASAITTYLSMAPGSEGILIQKCTSNTRLRRRLESIHRRGHLASVTIGAVRTEAIKHGIDPNQIIRNGQLHFDQVSSDDLLKLLNEDLLIGGLSGTKFAVDKKIPR